MPTFLIAWFTGTSVVGSVMVYCVSVKSPGRAAAPLLIRALKLIEVGAAPPAAPLAGVSNACGIATSTLSPLLEKPNLSGAPPFSSVGTPADVSEYR